MTLTDFRDIVLTADPAATHYWSGSQGNYTIWTEFGETADYADSKRSVVFKSVQVDRYTKLEYDPVVDSLRAALDAAGIPYAYLCDPNQDTGYIHHIFDCTAI